jgi:Zn-dependent peptidase ImmA (M78 family)/transcriptional regulator with XRE-family HTH domain
MVQHLQTSGGHDVRASIAGKLKTARSFSGLSTRAVASKLAARFSISHATIANFESGRSTPPLDVLAAFAELYDRPLNWFLESGQCLTGVRYRNLKSKVRISELHKFEADVQRWVDAYVILEQRLNRPLTATISNFRANNGPPPDELARDTRRELGIGDDEVVPSVIDVLERFGIRTIENSTDLRIDGLAARYGDEYIVALNPSVSNDRTRFNAGHELAHVLYGDCEKDEEGDKSIEARAFEFASNFLLPNGQLKRAFEGQSMVRLVQFKERFGISLAAMIYRAEKLSFISKQTAKMLWVEFSRRGWKTSEPGFVRPDRATRFEQLVDEAVFSNKLSLKEIADISGVRPEAVKARLNFAMGIKAHDVPEDEGTNMLQFPR